MTVVVHQDCDLVRTGVAGLFGRFPTWLTLVQGPPAEADLVLFDWRLGGEDRTAGLTELLQLRRPKVAVYTWAFDPSLIMEARAAGVAGYLCKGMAGPDLVDAVVRIHHGERLV